MIECVCGFGIGLVVGKVDDCYIGAYMFVYGVY